MHLVAKNSDEDVREITSVSITANSERLRIGVLRTLEGVDWPTASAVLHFLFDDLYPILDERAMRTVGGSTSYNMDRWPQDTRLCRGKAKEYGVSLRDLDLALWVFDQSTGIPLG